MSVWLISSFIFGFIFIALMVLGFVFSKQVNLKERLTEATIGLVLVTIMIGSFQMYELEKQNKARFLLDLKQSYYYSNDTNRRIIEALDRGDLRWHPGGVSEGTRLPADSFTDYQLDEYLINFDYINIFLKKGMLDERDVNAIFGWDIRDAWRNKDVQAYIKAVREKEKDTYGNFEELALKMIKYR